MTIEEPRTDARELGDEEPLKSRRAMGCCAIIIIIIFVVALIVGYSPWFRPFFP